MFGVDWGQVADFINVVGGLGGVVALLLIFWLKGTFVTKADYEQDRIKAAFGYAADRKQAADAYAADRKLAEDALTALADRFAAFDLALVEIKAALKVIPDTQELHRLALTIERLNGTVAAVQTELKGAVAVMQRVETMVNRHEDHLLDRKA